jgi:hypothetical protein
VFTKSSVRLGSLGSVGMGRMVPPALDD